MAERRNSPDQKLVRTEARALSRFFGKETIPQPPRELLEFLERTTKIGLTLEPYFEPAVTFSKQTSYPGWQVKPDPWFWEMIRKGNILPEAVRLSGTWMAMEALPKPNYTDGTQLHQNDALAPILEKLRGQGGIKIPDWCKHIPATSRFGISPSEIEEHIIPAFVETYQPQDAKVSLPCYMSWNYRGNIAHPEWGETTTFEWFKDRFGSGGRLYGGDSGNGGLGFVSSIWRPQRRFRLPSLG